MRISKGLSVAAGLILGLMGVASNRVEAAFVIYTESVTGSGSLGGVAFTNALITITGTADTSNVTGPVIGPGIFTVLTSTKVSVNGTGMGTFTDAIQAVSNQINPTALAGFGDNTTNLFVLGTNNTAFASYDLKSSIGPLSGMSVYNTGAASATTAGNFIINSVAQNATFTASVGVPEPSSLVLCGIAGVVGLGMAWRRRRRAAAVA